MSAPNVPTVTPGEDGARALRWRQRLAEFWSFELATRLAYRRLERDRDALASAILTARADGEKENG